MLSQSQIIEIQEHLERAQNPVFFFDNDVDGFVSFLLLARFIERGKGVAIKSFPDLSVNYFKKVQELNADYIFVLDKNSVSDEFLDEVSKVNLPVVWIDHHDAEVQDLPEFVSYYNPGREPTTMLCSQITNKKDDLWLAVVGCVSDRYLPLFYNKVKEQYPDLCIDSDDAFDIVFGDGLGKIERMLNYNLKDTTTNVVNMIRFLLKVKSPYDILDERKENKRMHERFSQVDEKTQDLMKKAFRLGESSENLIVFEYAGDVSMSANLSNALMHSYPEKTIVVIYKREESATISIRGNDIRDKSQKVILGLDNATCGGHDEAVGAKIMLKDLEEFKKRIKEEFE